MKKGHELKIRERLSKSYLQVIFIASISAIVGIIALLVMTRMYNNALNNYGFSQGDIGKAMTAFSGARNEFVRQWDIWMKILSVMPRIRIIREKIHSSSILTTLKAAW